MENLIIGYARVSTTQQNLDSQIKVLTEYGCQRIFSDKVSGKDMEREGYKAAKGILRKNDVFVVDALDRISRDYNDLRNEWKDLMNMGVKIVVLSMPYLSTGNTLTDSFLNNLLVELFGYIAQQERQRIHERQRNGIEAAQKQGKHMGRPAVSINKEQELILSKWHKGDITGKECYTFLGISKTTLYKNFPKSITKITQQL